MTIKDLPAINWIDLHNTGDYTKLSRTGKICKRVRIVFDKIRDEVIDTFGVSEEFLRIHRANINIELLECELLHTGDNTLKFHIQMEKKILSDFLKPLTGSKNDLFDAMVWIKKQQISFNENEVSTFWFLKYINHLVNQAKEEAKKQKKWQKVR
jgi:hypothetical protein